MKIFDKFVEKLYANQVEKKQKAQKKKKLTQEEKQKHKTYDELNRLYQFVKWLNTKGLGNRHQRKAFWRAVMNNQPVLENVIQNIMNQYLTKPVPPKGKTVKGGETKPIELPKEGGERRKQNEK